MKKLLSYNFILMFIFMLFLEPSFSLAFSITDPLVPCTNIPTYKSDGKTIAVDSDGNTKFESKCDFNAFMTLINNVIHYILYYMVIPIAAIMFAYAGFLLVSAGGEVAQARTKAKSIFMNAVIGLIVAVAAFLVVRTLLSILGYNGSWIGFNPF